MRAAPEATLHDMIDAWRAGARDEQGLAALLDLVCDRAVAAIRAGALANRAALAEEIALLRAGHPLPIAGASDLLHVLQVWLRGEPGRAAQIRQKRAALPEALAQALDAVEQAIFA